MKKIFVLCAAALALISCNKSINKDIEAEEQEATLSLSLQVGNVEALTKATGDAHGNQANDNTVATLDILIFNNDNVSPGVGKLVSYKRFTASDGLANLQVRTTTGPKLIYAVANSHKATWTDVQSLGQFQALTTTLKNENIKDFVMVGSATVTMNPTTDVAITLERMAAKVVLTSFKTNFAGGPYAGQSLSSIKAYLVNVNSEKTLFDGSAIATTAWLNKAAFSSTDVAACTMTGCISDDIAGTVSDAGHATPHHFYAFENLVQNENAADRMTRLVIEATLDGVKYYYPININNPNYPGGPGWVSGSGHKGVKRNHQYNISVTITGPGSDSPDKPIAFGIASITCTVSDWVDVDCGTIEQ